MIILRRTMKYGARALQHAMPLLIKIPRVTLHSLQMLSGQLKLCTILIPVHKGAIIDQTTSSTIVFLSNNDGYPSVENFQNLIPGRSYSIAINNFGEDTASDVTVSWITLDTVFNSNQIGGGLRIKTLTNYSSGGVLAGKRSFQYKIPGTAKSSAIVDKIPDVYLHFTERGKQYIPQMAELTSAHYAVTCYYSTVHSSDVSTTPRQTSTNISYEYVTEINYDSINGKTLYRYSKPYTFQVDSTGNNPDLSNSVKGQLLEKKDYVYASGTFSLVREENNEYDFDLFSTSSYYNGYKFSMIHGEVDEPATFEYPIHTFIPASFYFNLYTQQNYCHITLSKKIVKDYTPVAVRQTTSFYEYDYSLLRKERVVDGSDTIVTNNDYYYITSPFIAPRTISKPTVVKKSVQRPSITDGKEIIDSKKLDYQFVSGKLVPKEMFYLENDALIDNPGLYVVSCKAVSYSTTMTHVEIPSRSRMKCY